MSWLSSLEALAVRRSRAGLRRELRPRPEDDGLVDLAGNDYLGLSRHPEVVAAASAAVKAYGVGATASRLVRGSTDLHASLEAALAEFLGCAAALVYSSGYLANLGAVRAFAGALIGSDAHNHASLVDACRLARAERAGGRTVVYAHADAASLAAGLAAGLAGSTAAGSTDRLPEQPQHLPRRLDGLPPLVVSESVFSVHGDLAPLADLHRVAGEHGGVLCVDDAHGLGVIGPSGRGGAAGANLSGECDVVVTATLSKALGAAGGVVAGPAAYIEHLVQTSRTFIYDTGLAPGAAAAALAALELIRGEAGAMARAELADRVGVASARLRAAGLRVPEPCGGILCVGAPGPAEALAWAGACRARGVAVGCFRPPSTPDGGSWLRLTVNVGVARDDFDRALEIVIVSAREAGC